MSLPPDFRLRLREGSRSAKPQAAVSPEPSGIRMSKSRFPILLYRTHAWVGLISGIFLIVICVTGSIAVFRPEIERAVDWGDYDFNVVSNGRAPIGIEQAIATAEARFPGGRATAARKPARGGSW